MKDKHIDFANEFQSLLECFSHVDNKNITLEYLEEAWKICEETYKDVKSLLEEGFYSQEGGKNDVIPTK
ncbi:MAG TPA: hypothetical protein ENG87_03985 [Candidatus Pacearchaeota archaeon]|nr:hypothetical protein [Candidatus Pacearchaeota archaeon]HDZ61191.1 hypothetical protein [Candidatus Pacearchaeota archaeon]